MPISEFAQERARQAFLDAQEARTTLSAEDAKKYASYVKKLPAYIITNGLAASVAFAQEKGGYAWDEIIKGLYERLKQYGICDAMQYSGFMTWLLEQKSDDYRRATSEAMAYLEWLRRFAGEE